MFLFICWWFKTITKKYQIKIKKEREREYCWKAGDSRASFTGRWCAKEAVIKAISSAAGEENFVVWDGASASLIDIEIIPVEGSSPNVILHGKAKDNMIKAKVSEVKVSISHSGAYAIAVAYAK